MCPPLFDYRVGEHIGSPLPMRRGKCRWHAAGINPQKYLLLPVPISARWRILAVWNAGTRICHAYKPLKDGYTLVASMMTAVYDMGASGGFQVINFINYISYAF